jgi:hypothetical protein
MKISKRAFTFLILFSVLPLAAEAECYKASTGVKYTGFLVREKTYEIVCDSDPKNTSQKGMDLTADQADKELSQRSTQEWKSQEAAKEDQTNE